MFMHLLSESMRLNGTVDCHRIVLNQQTKYCIMFGDIWCSSAWPMQSMWITGYLELPDVIKAVGYVEDVQWFVEKQGGLKLEHGFCRSKCLHCCIHEGENRFRQCFFLVRKKKQNIKPCIGAFTLWLLISLP